MSERPSPKKRDIRAVSPGEKVLCVLLLLLMGGIGGFVFWKGRRYDPRLFALSEDLLGQKGQGTAQGFRAQFLPLKEGGDWQPSGSVETFTAENLYVKIDGRAEQYLQYGVVGLECQTYAAPDDPDRFVDVFVYHMGTPIQAFGIFSAERGEGAERISLGEQGYRSGPNLFFWQGPYYVQVLASEDAPSLREAAQRLAQALSARLPRGNLRLWALEVWNGPPWETETLQYHHRNALALDFLDHTFTIHRQGDPDSTKVFLSLRSSSEEAQSLWGKFLEYYRQYGTLHRQGKDEEGEWLLADVAGFYDALSRQGPLLVGVSGYGTGETAQARLGEVRQRLTHLPQGFWERTLPEWRKVLATPSPLGLGGEEKGKASLVEGEPGEEGM